MTDFLINAYGLTDSIFVLAKDFILALASHLLPDWGTILLRVFISITAIAIFGPLTMMYLTLIERKTIARMQNRIGPNRVGKYGLLQPVADGIKMFIKEDIVPAGADKLAHFLSPVAVVIPSLLAFSVLPFGRNMTAVDLTVGLLFFLAVSSVTTIAIFMGAWASRNKFSLLGGMRTVAQMISYEIPMVLSVVPVILVTESLSTVRIVEAQGGLAGFQWFVFTPWGLVAFLIFFISGISEVNRTPFDLPEAESEIVAGFHTEYSGMKFALFYMAEFMNSFAISGLTVTLFLGGWQGPLLPSWLWFLIKTYLLIFVLIWLRGTFPRLRVDQLMGFAWRGLLPMGLVNIFAACLWLHYPFPGNWFITTLVLIASLWILQRANKKEMPEKRAYLYAE